MPAYVNLDALVPREDFAVEAPETVSTEMFGQLGIDRILAGSGSSIVPHLRKPDFQRETNHWHPAQICTFLQSFVDNDLVPALILWNSKTHIFVIDGCHRISALRAWIEDDYGDGPISIAHFGMHLPVEQVKVAKKTRDLVNEKVKSFKDLQAVNTAPAKFAVDLAQRAKTTLTRSLQIQWIHGNAEKAETSFFKINTLGTILDPVEERLLKNRRKPAAISARAVVRAGRGHAYWSAFEEDVREEIERIAKEMYDALFEPELALPVKTLNIPVGGPYSSHKALDLLMDFIEVVEGAFGEANSIEDEEDDTDGTLTVGVLNRCLRTANRIVGVGPSSLGLDPLVYFYTVTARFNRDIFLAFVELFAIAEKTKDKAFYFRFTDVRQKLEQVFIDNKALVTQLNIATNSKGRRALWVRVVRAIIAKLAKGEDVTPEFVMGEAGFSGDVLSRKKFGASISDEVKSAVYIKQILSNPMRCPVCQGVLSQKSISYDHKKPKSQGGTGSSDNVQLTHPFCNTGYKNKADQEAYKAQQAAANAAAG